jgi:hypothetical protein
MSRLAFTFVLASFSAHAGIVLKWDRTRGDEPATTLVMTCEGGNARFEGSGTKGRTVLWDAKARALHVIKTDEKTFSTLSEAQLLALRERAKAAIEKIKAASTPEKRAEIDAMTAEPEWKLTATGQKAKPGQWDCELYDAEKGTSKLQMCIVPWAKSPAKKEDLDCVKSVAELFKMMSRGALSKEADFAEDLTKFPGLAVQSTRDMGGGKKAISTLKTVEKVTPPPGAFTVPADFKQVDARD